MNMSQRKEYWRRRLGLQNPDRTPVVRAMTAEKPLGGVSNAIRFYCDDGKRYAVKTRAIGRCLGADRIVATIANEIGYPVPAAVIVDVPEALIPYLPPHDVQQVRWISGKGHGIEWIGLCRDSRYPIFAEGDNIQRYSDLAILFGASMPCDQQFLCESNDQKTVWSVDHGMFLEIEELWSDTKFAGFLTRDVTPDPWITAEVHLPTDFIQTTCRKFSSLSDERIASLVGSVPTEWGISFDEKLLICAFLSHNRDAFTSRFASDAGVA